MEQRFELEISRNGSHSWCGLLHTQTGVIPFRSELELLFELERCVGGTQAGIQRGRSGDMGSQTE